MAKSENINFVLKGIKTDYFSIAAENYTEGKASELNTAMRFGVDAKTHIIAAFVSLSFLQDKKPFIQIEVSCHFQIDSKSWKNFLDKKGIRITIPKGFLAHMSMITVGTARGILYEKTEGMTFNKFIVPTINVTSMIKEDASFAIDKANG
jgi:hypothetical protein